MKKALCTLAIFLMTASYAEAKRIYEYTNMTAPASTDELLISDTSDSSREFALTLDVLTTYLEGLISGVPDGTASNQLLQWDGTAWAATSTLAGIGDITGAGSYNNITVTQPATGATLTLVEGSTLATSGAYSTTLTATGATNVTLPTTGTLMATSAIGSTVQAYDADLTSWAAIPPSTGNLETSGTIQGNVVFNSYTAAQTLSYADHNSSIVQMTTADEVTMWDCETAGIGATVMLWARDAEKIEVVPASGDHFNLFDGTALTANNELDMAATAGTKVTLMCTSDDTWSVYSETAASTDGGAAD